MRKLEIELLKEIFEKQATERTNEEGHKRMKK